MGKIFGISDLPVTTFMTPFEPVRIVVPRVRITEIRTGKNTKDLYISQNGEPNKRGFLRMRNGIGRLMRPNGKKEIH